MVEASEMVISAFACSVCSLASGLLWFVNGLVCSHLSFCLGKPDTMALLWSWT